MKRILGSPANAVQAKLIVAQRRWNFWFSVADEELQKLQQTRGFDSDLWVSWFTMELCGARPKRGERSHKVPLVTATELWNLDDLATPSTFLANLPPVERPTNLEPKDRPAKGFPPDLEFELENRAALRGLTSKYWLSPYAAKSRGLQPRANNIQTSILLSKKETTLFNVDQLQDREQILHVPISGGTGKALVRDSNPSFYDALVTAQKENCWRTGVVFSYSHARSMNLEVQAEATGIIDPTVIDRFSSSLYNVSQLENWEEILGGRTANDHEFFDGNTTIAAEHVRAAVEEAAHRFPHCKIWIGERLIAKLGFRLRPEEIRNVVRIPPSRTKLEEVRYFNLDCMYDSESAKAALGTFVR
jgi:hypothetical protein